MKYINIIKSIFFAFILLVINTGCVHDDDYSVAEIKCTELTPTTTIAQLKAMYTGTPTKIAQDLILVGYVSSSDETGNIYKTLYIQDALKNPTHGLTISVDATDMYNQFPLGAKVYIKLKGLYLGEYGGVIQLGDIGVNDLSVPEFGRIPGVKVAKTIFKSCDKIGVIEPKEITIPEFNDNLIGALVKIKKVEFMPGVLCSTYALNGVSVNKYISDCNNNKTIVRNSGFATFYNQVIPDGNGDIVAILSKFNSDYQLFIRSTKDVEEMKGARCFGYSGCIPPTDNSSIKTLKEKLVGNLTQITEDLNITVTVTANDETDNLFQMIYVEDETGGIRVRLNRTNLFLDPKFKVGEKITIAAKNLYLGLVSGEIHLGALSGTAVANIPDSDINKYIYDNKENSPVNPTLVSVSTSPNLDAHVGKLVKFENVEFDSNSLDLPYASSTANTNRTLKDCNGTTITVRTSSFATFREELTPTGKGSIIGILSVFNNTYQILLRTNKEVKMEDVRCDGTVITGKTLFYDRFESSLNDKWINLSLKGSQVWNIQSFGNPAPCTVMNGFANNISNENEDWLISNTISLKGFNNYSLSFDTDGKFTGNPLEVYITENYTGDVSTTTWTKLNVNLDTDLTKFSPFVNSGNINLNNFAGKDIRIAFKYTSTSTASTTWEVDNVKVKGF